MPNSITYIQLAASRCLIKAIAKYIWKSEKASHQPVQIQFFLPHLLRVAILECAKENL